MKLCFLTRKLDFGGAERQLLSLVKTLPKDTFDITVIEFYEGGGLVPELLKVPGIRRICLNKSTRWHNITFFFKLLSTLRQLKPEILHGYLDVPNILIIIVKPFLNHSCKTVMGLRSSNVQLQIYDRLAAFCSKCEKKLAPFADLIIANSHAGKASAIKDGYPESKVIVISNGVDFERFYIDENLRSQQRQAWNITPEQLLIGMTARFDRKKNHPIFLEACKIFLNKFPHARFVQIGGGGQASYRHEVQALATSLNLDQHLIWAGELPSMCAAYNALDINTLCSNAAEGFPNVLAEAMACGVPCVSTASGDAKLILADLGVVAEAATPQHIATAWEKLLARGIKNLRPLVSQHIQNSFSVKALANQTSQVLITLAKR